MKLATFLLPLILGPSIAAAQQTELPEISSSTDTDSRDLTFRIQHLGNVRDDRLLQLAGLYRGAPVAIDVILEAGWQQGRISSTALVVFSGTVTLRSVGEQSDRFLAALNELYGTSQPAQKMRAQTEFTAMSIEGDPTHLKDGPVTLELSFESNDKEHYAEFSLNIDVANDTVVLAEKRPAYRAAIVRVLSGS